MNSTWLYWTIKIKNKKSIFLVRLSEACCEDPRLTQKFPIPNTAFQCTVKRSSEAYIQSSWLGDEVDSRIGLKVPKCEILMSWILMIFLS
jgi:hypothetical protein